MLDQNTFTETIRAVQDIIRTSAEPMTREEILSYFKDMDLNAQQEEMVLEFLSTPHDDPQPEENEPETKEAEYEEIAEKEETKESSAKKESAKDSVTDNISTSPMFQMYLEELKDIPEYTKEQQIDMYKKLLAGEESMVHALSNAWLRNVLEVAKKLAVSPDGFEDIVQEGNMALFLRLSELCGGHEKVDVEEELLTAVEEAMKSCIREQTGEDENENSVVGKVALVSEAVNYLKKQNGAQPTQKELADYVKIPFGNDCKDAAKGEQDAQPLFLGKGFVKDQVGADRRNGRCRRRNQGAVCHRRELETVELEHGIEHLSIDSHKNNPRPICLAGEKLCHVPTETEVLVKEDDHADDEEPEGRNGCWRPIREQPFERNGLESPQKPDEGQEDICCLRADDHRPL